MTQHIESFNCDFAFGPYRLLKEKRSLLCGDTPVKLGGRAFDLLLTLLERAGEVVTRRELEAHVWPNSVVEETSLRAHVSALRRALADGQAGTRYIDNVPGRGYCFVGSVVRGQTASSTAMHAGSNVRRLPSRLTRMIGRSETLIGLTQRLLAHRLVTIVGPGGIGKTTLALAVAGACADARGQGALFVDLAPVTDGDLVPATVATALELSLDPQDQIGSLVQALKHTDVLLVMDNCEHLIEAVANLCECLLSCTSVSILATSREPMDIDGEWTHRLAPLDSPPAEDLATSEQAIRFPAVELFVERASASGSPFVLDEDNVADVCSLTRQLDGLPLAVELVAARVPSLGLHELVARVGDRLSPLFRGRRTAAPRHQTLAAMLDWSYQLLSTSEKIVLRRLSVFRGTFTLDGAAHVASGDCISQDDVLVGVVSLATKSLVSVDMASDPVEYRLLDTTRAFAMQKLREGEPADPVFKRHASEMQRRLATSDASWDSMSRQQWLAIYRSYIDDVRAALQWCFSENGDMALGVQTTALSSAPLQGLGLLVEQAERVERALLYAQQLRPPQPELELRLNAALTWPSANANWRGRPQLAVLSRNVELAEQLGDAHSRIVALYSSWLGAFVTGDYLSATSAAKRANEIANQAHDEAGVVLTERLLAQCHHFMGDHGASREYAERSLGRGPCRMPGGYSSVVSRKVSMRIVLARVLWLEGLPDSAAHMTEQCLQLAEDSHPHALMQTLGVAAIPIALWRGERDVAADHIARLNKVALHNTAPYWQSWARSLASVLEAGTSRMPVVQTLNAKEVDCVASVASVWSHSVSLQRANSGASGWCCAEIVRKHGEHLLAHDDKEASRAAEREFARAMDIARRQGVLAWELRAAMSQAHLWIRQGRFLEAKELVAPLYARFKEGLETADLQAARHIISA